MMDVRKLCKCGAKAELHQDREANQWRVICKACGLTTAGWLTMFVAVIDWNYGLVRYGDKKVDEA